MNLVLSNKASYADEDVHRVWRNIEDYVSEDEAQQAVEAAVAETKDVISPIRSKVAYGWSGGKDSVALEVVMEKAGVKPCMLGLVGALEWRGYLKWVSENAPAGLTVFSNDSVTLEFLADPYNHKYVFPDNSTDGYWWTLQSTRRAQREYQRLYSPELQIYGRRTQDGNYIGSGAYGIFEAGGIRQYSPIRDWPHEMVLAVIRYYGKSLPPIPYEAPYGWTTGTGGWPGRRYGEDWEESFYITGKIEIERLKEASPHFAAAKRALARHVQEGTA
jgi:3'-phosphoadenosine 5'-phosphosulfate sulfotransferase (PAPS reductase)/FAD synthetase